MNTNMSTSHAVPYPTLLESRAAARGASQLYESPQRTRVFFSVFNPQIVTLTLLIPYYYNEPDYDYYY